MLSKKGYDVIDDDEEYKYLTKMPMDSVTEENVERLLKDKDKKKEELETVKNKTIRKMWLDELVNLRNLYIEYKTERSRVMNGEDINNPSKKKVVTKGLVKKTVKKISEDKN